MNGNMEKEIFEVYLDDIIPNRFQPRLSFDSDALNDLAESIKKVGIIQPLVLRKIGDKYEIIAGERRYKASIIAGLIKVPAIIMSLDDNSSAEVALIENVQREALNPLEEAKSYEKLLNRGYITQDQLAKRIGKSQSTVANKIRLLNLTNEVQNALLNNQISERHARSLLALKNENDQNEFLRETITKKLTVRQLDKTIQEKIGGSITMNNNDFNGSNPFDQSMLKPVEVTTEQKQEEEIRHPMFELPGMENSFSNFDNLKEGTKDIYQTYAPAPIEELLKSPTTFETPVSQATVEPEAPSFKFFAPDDPETLAPIPLEQAPVSSYEIPPMPDFGSVSHVSPTPNSPNIESLLSEINQSLKQYEDIKETPNIPNFIQTKAMPVNPAPMPLEQAPVSSYEIPSMSTFGSVGQVVVPNSPNIPTFNQTTAMPVNPAPMSLEQAPNFNYQFSQNQMPTTIETSIPEPTNPFQSIPAIPGFQQFNLEPNQANMNFDHSLDSTQVINVGEIKKAMVSPREYIEKIKEAVRTLNTFGLNVQIEELELSTKYKIIVNIEK